LLVQFNPALICRPFRWLFVGLVSAADKMRASSKLSSLFVKSQKIPGRYGDGGGLWLQVTKSGGKSWLLRYMLDGKARHMGLGPVELVSLADARELARTKRRMLLDGIDPIEERKATRANSKAESARNLTFQECAEQFISAHEAGWRNAKHREQWRNTLSTYAYPVLGGAFVGDIDVSMILKAIEPIWKEKSETASRLRGRMEAILDWATVREYRSGDNPARWRGHLDKLLPSRAKITRVVHHSALPYSAIPKFMAELRERQSLSARALEFTILTTARTGEVIGARWQEIDLGKALWTIPETRMKAGREHRVPLTNRTMEILQGLPCEKDTEFIFIGTRARQPISNMAMLELLRGMNSNALTVHGFRSTFRDWAAECTNHPREVAEMALAHTISDSVEAAYRRGDLFEKRRALMIDWDEYCRTSIED